MPIYATAEAKEFWQKCHSKSRSLAASHFVSIAESKDDKQWRKQSCDAIKAGKSNPAKTTSWARFAASFQSFGGALVFGKLEARLIVDSAGGVLENGGLCLDRTSGIPFIPGSAVKGATRHFAISQLSEAETVDEKAQLLAQICRIFGYGSKEWTSGRRGKQGEAVSDFWLAMVPLFDAGQDHDALRDELWKSVSEKAADILIAQKGWRIASDKTLSSQLPNLAGSICFLPAFPERDPGIEIDVLTCHHTKYYSGAREIATDDDDPNPVPFPAVAPGVTFIFPLFRNGLLAHPDDINYAKSWLTEALQIFGLGAKTNAGYGWFSIDVDAERKWKEKWDNDKKEAIEKEIKAKMSPEEKARYELEKLDATKFSERVRDLAQRPKEEQIAICALLKDSKAVQWADWKKPKAKKWQPRLPGIREIASKHGIQLP